jgi:hypothetical protein
MYNKSKVPSNNSVNTKLKRKLTAMRRSSTIHTLLPLNEEESSSSKSNEQKQTVAKKNENSSAFFINLIENAAKKSTSNIVSNAAASINNNNNQSPLKKMFVKEKYLKWEESSSGSCSKSNAENVKPISRNLISIFIF